MADPEAEGAAGTPPRRKIRPIPALRLNYAHRLLLELERRGPIGLEDLLERFAAEHGGSVEELFKSARQHRKPLDRARQLIRYARELGLVEGREDGRLALSQSGRTYVAAGDEGVFTTTPSQRALLRDVLADGVRGGNGIPLGVVLTLEILQELPDPAEVSLVDLGEALAQRGGMAGWRQPRTFEAQAERFLALAEDAELIGPGRVVKQTGRSLLAVAAAGSRRETRAAPQPADPPTAAVPRRRAWIVRAGRGGEYEQLALSQGVCLIGWSELGRLPRGISRDELKASIEQTYDEHRSRSLASQAGQIHRFVEDIAVGDVVVLPLMSAQRHVAVGRVTGEYVHREDGAFTGTDAQHTRGVEWLTQRMPYERFDDDLQASFRQQGTISEIGAIDAAQRLLAVAQEASAIHLVLKWSTRLGADTIERHLEVEAEHGAVWWGRVSKPGTTGLAVKWLDKLQAQLEHGVPTSVFLRGATTWHARLLAITNDRAEVEEDLVPAYYDPATHHSLWVKLTDLQPVEEAEISADFVLAKDGAPVTAGGLANQTPLILRGPARGGSPGRGAFTPPRPVPGAEQAAPDPPRRTPAPVHAAQAARPSPTEAGRRAAPSRPLDLATLRRAAERKKLRLPDETYAQILAVLLSGKHLILTGPPGTAKTTLAIAIAEAAEEVGMCAGHVPTTATADWTTNETIGGLRPLTSGELAFEEGHFVTAMRQDRWLVIDELNRSQFDRAFGQLFTVLSGHRVVLPYHRRGGDPAIPLALVPDGPNGSDGFDEGVDAIPISRSWRIVATMNVFDKTLLFDMSFALMRRFGFVEVGCPDDETFGALIDTRSGSNERAARLARELMELRRFKDIGPALYMDLTDFLRERIALQDAEDGQLRFEAFYTYLLPQFEGIQGGEGDQLHDVVSRLVGEEHRDRLRRTFTAVLGLELTAAAPADAALDLEDDAGPPDTL